MKKILITGSNGFIGKNLVDNLSNLYDVCAPKREELDLLNTNIVEKYLKLNKFDVIIHAANTNSTRNIKTTNYEVLDRNLKMFFNLERCKEHYGKMYYFGSGAEYDMNNYRPMMNEEYFGEYIPSDAYGFSKYVMSRISEEDNNIYNLRLFGVFGKYEEWERRFISNAICRCIYDLPITIRQNVYFDYLYVDDLVQIMKFFIENTPKRKHYNVCTGKRIDLLNIAKRIIFVSNKNLDIIIKKNGLKPEYTGSNYRLLDEIGEIKFTPLDVAIERLYEYYLINKNYISIKKMIE
ncbi:NAD(P)-dependent oxidoreductase [Clostridium sporogenes]|uniref:NAD-dependent epimerase/dehydratase family protein n=1 Tax=Clostridium TaxID=1485 RepID=UPI000E06FD36|nr:NAD(P)-dependent oxidoreductase [Clostridium sporogenes]MCW6087401.1 NAD(P)-dependent oxidoreductase [Clostridium sporogenes]MCW6087734.1 NAD(P)-dependent oxidoreductase [Clostridium sporogenes]NFH45830.1 NAD-dependent epimerase/dehydratase family protein [Clostridium sporogenes]STC82155.1 NAD dependent epimerase/dehydratase family [Clostridium botulinum]